MNAMKSDLYTTAIVGEDLEEIQAITGIPLGTMPFLYLGIPLSDHKLRPMHYAPFIDKIASYINAWTTSSLSYAGRAELIRSVLQGVECFCLSIFPLPAGVIDRITKLCRNFLWNSKNAPVAWDDVCLPKAEGGLGFRGIKAWNEALLTKALWNIHNKKDTLWVRWVHNIYLKNCTLWQWTMSREDSPSLKCLLRIRDKICTREGTVEAAVQRIQSWDNGNGLSIAMAYDYFRDSRTKNHWAADVWNACVTPKHAFTFWIGIKQRLLTRDRLHYLDIDKACAFCGRVDKSVQHIFFECTFSGEIWRGIRDWIGIRRSMTTIASALKWIKKEGRGTTWHGKAKRMALASTVYHIWIARNR
ncbi:putative ribonuclease h protein at1g65750 [Phtheirospermum japonicum]|uniref:Putative ribonuclease h protein at1g65750 n=1 Tax=Phtheirospermum japonicum TaxID=374723 RepID=A0A830BKR6_9LAMI|nr:putative ribonuclease h protein at1g65750 [Phtheirospermum japonicum]